MSIRSQRWRFSSVLGAAALITGTGVGALPALAVDTAPTAVASTVATAWGGGSRGGWPDRSAPESSSEGSSAGTVSSDPATAAEGAGVALIDTELAYQGAAGAGTGIVLTGNGEVLTNYHVVEGATEVKVTIATTGKTYPATVVGHSESKDIALLQLKGASGLATATIDDDTVTTGEAVTAVGNAGGTGMLTAAPGTVTSLGSSITTASEGSISSETLTGLIETDADVVAGDSGGPLLDAEGEVIGIDTAASTGDEIDGYAIPIAKAEAVVRQIRSGKESSTVQVGASPFLGIQVGDAAGVTVLGVLDQSAAAGAGLGAGDTLTAIGSNKIASSAALAEVMARHNPGDRVQLRWTDSAGDANEATVTLGSSPEA